MIYFDFVKKDLTVLLCRENNNFFVRTGIYIVSKKTNGIFICIIIYIYIYVVFSIQISTFLSLKNNIQKIHN